MKPYFCDKFVIVGVGGTCVRDNVKCFQSEQNVRKFSPKMLPNRDIRQTGHRFQACLNIHPRQLQYHDCVSVCPASTCVS